MSSNGRLRVLQLGKFYPPHWGGMETHLQSLAAELRKSMRVNVLVASDHRRTTRATIDGVDVTRVGTAFKLAGAPICPQMATGIRDAEPDLIHIHLPNPNAVLAYLLSGREKPVVATWHSDAVRQKRLARFFEPLQRAVLQRCGALIATSPNYLASSPTLATYRERCRLIPYGISMERFRSCGAEAVDSIRGRHGPRIALCVARLVYYKGIEYLIRAMPAVRGKLLILGDGPMRQTLEREVRLRGVQDRVEFVGAVADPVPYYQACDVFVLPSTARSEAFGIVQLEAMACGKPVVNTQLASGVPFVSVDGMTGITVAPRDPLALAGAINRLMEDPKRRALYGQAGLRRVQQEFNLEKMVNSTMALYREVADSYESSKAWGMAPEVVFAPRAPARLSKPPGTKEPIDAIA